MDRGLTGRNGNSQRSSDLHSKSRSDISYDSAYRICLSITCQTLFLALIKFLLILLPFFFRNSNSFHETLIMPRTDIEHNCFQFQFWPLFFHRIKTGKLHDLPFRHFLLSIVEDHKLRGEDLWVRFAVTFLSCVIDRPPYDRLHGQKVSLLSRETSLLVYWDF